MGAQALLPEGGGRQVVEISLVQGRACFRAGGAAGARGKVGRSAWGLKNGLGQGVQQEIAAHQKTLGGGGHMMGEGYPVHGPGGVDAWR